MAAASTVVSSQPVLGRAAAGRHRPGRAAWPGDQARHDQHAILAAPAPPAAARASCRAAKYSWSNWCT